MSVEVPVDHADLEQARERWRRGVAGVLAKAGRRDPADLGDQPERELETPTYEGFAIRALYTAFDALPEPPLPGGWPFVRGADPLRDVKSGWKVAEVFPAADQAGTAGNPEVLAALADGVSALVLQVGPDGVPAAEVDRLLEGVYLELLPVMLRGAGPGDYTVAADAVLALVDNLAKADHQPLSIDLGADPLTAPLSGHAAPAVDEVTAMAARLAGPGRVRAITVEIGRASCRERV